MFKRKDQSVNDRVPPGQLLTTRFPVLHYGPVPKFDLQAWTFRVWGEVEKPLLMNWEEFSALPRTKMVMDLHCVTTWSKLDTAWEGVSLKTLFEMGLVTPKPQAKYIMQHAEHGFTVNLPIEVMNQDNFLLATHYDGKPITQDHGFPLRGVCGAIPGRGDLKDVYLWKGAKWLRGLEFTVTDRPGFWERAGYHNDADIWKEQRLQRD